MKKSDTEENVSNEEDNTKNFTKLENDKYNLYGNSISLKIIITNRDDNLNIKKNQFIKEVIKCKSKKKFFKKCK